MASAKYSRKVAATAPLNETITGYGYPGANVTTDDEWVQYIAENVRTPFHPCCTVSMLPQEDGGAVSNKLVVYGTSNLRVVDASVFPTVRTSSIYFYPATYLPLTATFNTLVRNGICFR